MESLRTSSGGIAITAHHDHLIKILILGDANVGKTSLMRRYADNEFSDDSVSTIGVDFTVCTVEMPDSKVLRLQLWDTAGQERFRTITSSYYRGAHGILLVFDVIRRQTFENAMKAWLRDIRMYASSEKVPLLLIGNKCDLATHGERQVTEKEGVEAALQIGARYIETSAKATTRVHEAFDQLVTLIYQLIPGGATTPRSPRNSMNDSVVILHGAPVKAMKKDCKC